MIKKSTIQSINGNIIIVKFADAIQQNEVGFVLAQGERLKAEVIKIVADMAYMQVFESTKELFIGQEVEFSGAMLSVRLGPGLLGQIFDGLQNPMMHASYHYQTPQNSPRFHQTPETHQYTGYNDYQLVLLLLEYHSSSRRYEL